MKLKYRLRIYLNDNKQLCVTTRNINNENAPKEIDFCLKDLVGGWSAMKIQYEFDRYQIGSLQQHDIQRCIP